MPVVDFSKLNKLSAKSFNEQKAMLKKVMLGRLIKCPICQLAISLQPVEVKGQVRVCCPNACTDIELDID